MKIAIIGADGQLGTDLCKVIDQQEQIPLTIKDIDITNKEQVESVFSETKPAVVINTAAYHRVDECEDKPGLAFEVNGLAPRNLAEACSTFGLTLVHISTDYVFDGNGKKPYSEADAPNPKSAYGISKLVGEFFVKSILKEHYIVRSCGLYGVAGCLGKGGGNFVEGMIKRERDKVKLRVVDDEVVGPTYTYDLAEKIVELVKTKKYGLYHITNQGSCSWWQFAAKIFELIGKKVQIEKATGADYKTKAHRPKYSVLENANLKRIGLEQSRNWEEALKAYLIEKKYLR
ncbi:dTDP-4-dehydrorhamnose reductase [Candidatus Margulisiibacteriota bacterium]